MNIWDAIYRAAWIALIALILIGVFSVFKPKIEEHRQNRRRKADIEEQIRMEQEMLKVIKYKKHRYYNDGEFVKQLAHKLGLAETGEVIFKHVEEGEPVR